MAPVPAFNLAPQLRRKNAQLQRCSIAQIGNRLYLRGTLPDQNDPAKRRQARIALGLEASPEQLKTAAAAAFELEEQLLEGRFHWADWEGEGLAARLRGEDPAATVTMPQFCEAIEALFDRKYPEVEKSWATIWGKKYKPAIALLRDMRGPCDQERLVAALLQVESPSSRKSTGSVFSQALALLDLPVDREAIAQAAAGYSRAELQVRVIPSDEELLEFWGRLRLPHWRWMFGIVMAFGIRPHEIIGCTLGADGVLEVPHETKTGNRQVWACPEEWIEELGLHHMHRPSQDKLKVSRACNDYLRDQGIAIPLYAARHAYAIRLLKYGISSDVGARLMGHSVEIHNNTYRHWIDRRHMAALRERIGHKFKREPGIDSAA
jgi:integrase